MPPGKKICQEGPMKSRGIKYEKISKKDTNFKNRKPETVVNL